MCRSEMSRAHSALVGTAIRIAECIGLHRDPSEFAIGPVESHVRRLIWYQLCYLDIRTAEVQGPRPTIRTNEFDTRYPSNVDDADFFSNPREPRDKKQFTEMTLTRVRFEYNEMVRIVWFDRLRLDKKTISLTHLLGKIEKFNNNMKAKYDHLLDDTQPLQYLTRVMMENLYTRMHIMTLHRYHNGTNVRIPDRLRQIILTSGTRQLETAMEMETHPAFQKWIWWLGAYHVYHTAFLLLVEVHAFPMRREADRIWRCLDYVYEVPPEMPRVEKGNIILTSIRDRLGYYRDLRRLRAPVAMPMRGSSLWPEAKEHTEQQQQKEQKREQNQQPQKQYQQQSSYPTNRSESQSPNSYNQLHTQQKQQRMHQSGSGPRFTGPTAPYMGSIDFSEPVPLPPSMSPEGNEWTQGASNAMLGPPPPAEDDFFQTPMAFASTSPQTSDSLTGRTPAESVEQQGASFSSPESLMLDIDWVSLGSSIFSFFFFIFMFYKRAFSSILSRSWLM